LRVHTAAPMRHPRSHFGSAVHGGKLYVFGGGGENFQSLDSVEVYDPGADRWKERTPMTASRSGIACATVGDRIYVMGGGFKRPDGSFDFKSIVEAYLPAEDRWEPAPSLLMRHDAPAAAVVDDEIFLFGGHHPDAEGGPLTDPAFDFCERLEKGGRQWREIAPMPTARFSLCAVPMPDGIWAMGGGAFRDGTFNNLDLIEVYDPLGGVWGLSRTRLPWAAAGLYAALHNGHLYVAGGNDGNGISSRLARWTGATWEKLPDLPEGRVMGAMVSVGDALLIAGGRTPDGKSVTGTMWRVG